MIIAVVVILLLVIIIIVGECSTVRTVVVTQRSGLSDLQCWWLFFCSCGSSTMMPSIATAVAVLHEAQRQLCTPCSRRTSGSDMSFPNTNCPSLEVGDILRGSLVSRPLSINSRSLLMPFPLSFSFSLSVFLSISLSLSPSLSLFYMSPSKARELSGVPDGRGGVLPTIKQAGSPPVSPTIYEDRPLSLGSPPPPLIPQRGYSRVAPALSRFPSQTRAPFTPPGVFTPGSRLPPATIGGVATLPFIRPGKQVSGYLKAGPHQLLPPPPPTHTVDKQPASYQASSEEECI